MNDMFKDWVFWKPIVKIAGGMGAWFLLLYVLPGKAAAIVAGVAMGIFFLGMLFYLGKTSYDIRQSEIKRNYKKLTGKDIDE